MDRLTKVEQACAVAVAAAQELNNELTVILSNVSSTIMALEPGHPARVALLELQCAAERSARRTSNLLAFNSRRGARAVRPPFDVLVNS